MIFEPSNNFIKAIRRGLIPEFILQRTRIKANWIKPLEWHHYGLDIFTEPIAISFYFAPDIASWYGWDITDCLLKVTEQWFKKLYPDK